MRKRDFVDGFYVLQSRWKICKRHLVCYGIRKAPYTFANSVKVPGRILRFLQENDGKVAASAVAKSFALKRLARQGILVRQEDKRDIPRDMGEARFCKNCVANDYLIPGLELDENGLCPMCASKERLKHLTAVLPTVSEIPRNPKGGIDVALFYTGGKDSTFLLYYLTKKLGLRVLALTWVTEYMSDSAKKNVAKAKEIFRDVRFEEKKPSAETTAKIYAAHYALAGNTCMCPSLAYVLFFEMLADEKVPYLVLGNEPVQMHNLLFNNISPLIAFDKRWQAVGRFFFNLGRIITFRKPLAGGQMQMYFTVRTLAKGTFWGAGNEGRYQNEQVLNVHEALKSAPEIFLPFCEAVRKNSKKGNLPRLVHMDFAKISDGYKWNEIKDLIEREAGWSAGDGKALHTSCKIEKCKEYTQLVRFRDMQSRTVPYSAVELSLAVSSGNVTREDALAEIERSGFFGCERETKLMKKPFERRGERD